LTRQHHFFCLHVLFRLSLLRLSQLFHPVSITESVKRIFWRSRWRRNVTNHNSSAKTNEWILQDHC
jgi:hypothetical protein